MTLMDETLKALAKPPLDEEQQAIEKTVTQWTLLAETGEDKLKLEDVPNNCYLCQYARKWKKGNESIYDTCKYCSYHKKYGHCNNTKGYKPYYKWKKANKADKRIHAAAFLAQVKTLRSKEMTDNETKLEQAKEDRKITLLANNTEVDRLAKLVAEEAQTKMRVKHMDYGIGKHGELFTVRGDGIDAEVYDEDNNELDMALGITNGCYRYAKKRGNLADDLKAIKPIEEYRTGNGMIVTFNNTTMHFSCQDVLNENIHDFILGLRGMEAKLIADGK